jgi:putative two-component system response regulator
MKTIFAVDDSDTNLSLAKKALEEYYRILTMPSATKMFTLLEKVTPDLILLDIEMPELNGVDAFQKLKADTTFGRIPVIFLTGRNDTAIEARCFELGAVDFITKPFSAPVLLNRIKTYLNIDQIIHERTMQLRRLQTGIVSVLADIVESRDKATDGHVERITAYIGILLEAMKERGIYADEIRDWDMEMVILSARLHDMGKIVVSDVVLNKPDKLTGEEYETMKSHPDEGMKIIEKMVEQTGEADFLQNAKLFAGYHHEHWDGSGYPRGLKGTEIPLQGRIMAMVDNYDALISRRSYKEALATDEAERIIVENAGKMFDPDIVQVFSEVKEQFKEAAVRLY